MTYKTVTRQIHFREQEGSSSIRITQRGYGGKGMVGIPLRILPSLKEQFETISKRIEELQALINGATRQDADRLRKELASKVSQAGDMRKILYDGSRMALERIFIKVARARLPDDQFISMLREAESHWRGHGIDKYIPEPTKQAKRRAERRLAHRSFKSGKER